MASLSESQNTIQVGTTPTFGKAELDSLDDGQKIEMNTLDIEGKAQATPAIGPKAAILLFVG